MEVQVVGPFVDQGVGGAAEQLVLEQLLDRVVRGSTLAPHGHRRQLVELDVGVPHAVAEDQVRPPDLVLVVGIGSFFYPI